MRWMIGCGRVSTVQVFVKEDRRQDYSRAYSVVDPDTGPGPIPDPNVVTKSSAAASCPAVLMSCKGSGVPTQLGPYNV